MYVPGRSTETVIEQSENMGDYFSEYSSFITGKGLPSPTDTPYETPSFIRSKRSSRATAGSSREQSTSPPPLPPDTTELQDKWADGKYSALDPRRFTPTLHASLVSEILNLRRELDSKNNLVENLETSLSSAKTENETLNEQLSQNVREVRKARQQVQQIEEGTYDAVEHLVQERDLVLSNADDLRSKLDNVQRTARRQDEDAERTQRIWEAEKESWDNERRQLERRIHVTESRLRTVVEEMNFHQAAAEALVAHPEEVEESAFKDSGLGNESDTGSIRSATPVKHRRNQSSLSFRSRSIRNSASTRYTGTPEPHAKPGYSLADEIGIDEEDEYDVDEFEHPEEDLDFPERVRKAMESRQSSVAGDTDSKAKRVLGLTTENLESATMSMARDVPIRSLESTVQPEPTRQSYEQPSVLPTVSEVQPTPPVQYVDTGYQPSPPPSPPPTERSSKEIHGPEMNEQDLGAEADPAAEVPKIHRQAFDALEVATRVAASPISPPETPVADDATWAADKRMSIPPPAYSSASTQTDFVESVKPKTPSIQRHSLSPPAFVPSIAIHPPTSRPSSPRPYVLPPGTKNASTQASFSWQSRDACIQTEEIRVDRRPVKLPPHLLPGYLLPSPTFQEAVQPPPVKRTATGGTAKIFTKVPPAPFLPSPPPQSPQEESFETSRNNSQKDLRSMPLRPIPLPRPVLSSLTAQEETFSAGPLNRSAQYGVTKPNQTSSKFLDIDKDSEISDNDDPTSDVEPADLAGSIPALSRPPHGRFGLSEPPKAVPEDKEISPERRPGTADSYGAAPAPSVSSSRAPSRARTKPPPVKLNAYKDIRSRSPSFGSVASSSYSTQSALPPFPIPTRSSSRVAPPSFSEGSQSPTTYHTDVFGHRNQRSHQPQHNRQGSLRKVQSAAVMRHPGRRGSPQKSRRRRKSPDLTPVQSMAFESPAATKFPIPDLPTPLQDGPTFDYVKGSMDLNGAPFSAASSAPRASEETNLVDAIAGTMVGEWMWKYIRKRKSFGVQEDFPVAEDGSVNTSQHGIRHKRWVWLSPYERTIMWDSKQPSSGTALLGKKGRKR